MGLEVLLGHVPAHGPDGAALGGAGLHLQQRVHLCTSRRRSNGSPKGRFHALQDIQLTLLLQNPLHLHGAVTPVEEEEALLFP